MSVLTPIRLAPAAPANEPLGIAWATNAEPRSTTKKPTAPPTTATIVRDDPGVDHEAGEHLRLTCGRRGSGPPRACRVEIIRASEVGDRMSVTTKKLTGQPWWSGGQ